MPPGKTHNLEAEGAQALLAQFLNLLAGFIANVICTYIYYPLKKRRPYKGASKQDAYTYIMDTRSYACPSQPL